MVCACSEQVTVTALEEGVTLRMSEASFAKICAKREEAVQKKLLIKEKDDYVPGTLELNGEKIEVRARLKGDHPDHFSGPHWSFRVKSSVPIAGHKKFSIQGVHTRAYLNEWIFHALLEREGLIHMTYSFFPFQVNDTLQGIYAFESHFDEVILDNRASGPILRFSEDEFWDYRVLKGRPDRDEQLMLRAKIELCNKAWKQEDKIVIEAKELLHAFRNGTKPVEEVFDTDAFATYVAINELMGSDHALRWHNLRLYYNRSTKKFSPIGFDSGSWMPAAKPVFAFGDHELFHARMFSSESYKKAVRQALERVSSLEYMRQFFDDYTEQIEHNELLIRQVKPDYRFSEATFYRSQRRILDALAQY